MLDVGADQRQIELISFQPLRLLSLSYLGNNLLTVTASVCPRNYATGRCFFPELEVGGAPSHNDVLVLGRYNILDGSLSTLTSVEMNKPRKTSNDYRLKHNMQQ